MSSSKRYLIPDPIAGMIELPTWLVKMRDEDAIRRMFFIRQLGLKAYIDYPGAIHTRYSHSLGTMHLAGKLTDLLIKKMDDKGNRVIAENLATNRDEIIAAGFLHDIAHGPFSHCVDYPLKLLNHLTHEELASKVIMEYLPDDFGNWVDRQQVIKIIKGKHDYPFISQIIDGPIDVDKLDYLLRDAHHVGLKYSFDLDHFLGSHTILGNQEELFTCKLGLENTPQSIVANEIFLVMWKGMYDLVYHIKDSRIAEKMLEKAILKNKNEEKIMESFQKIDKFIQLEDDKLLNILSGLNEETNKIIKNIKKNELYKSSLTRDLDSKIFEMSPNFLKELENMNNLSENITNEINEKMGCAQYSCICDIVVSKAPKDIHLDELDNETGEYKLLRDKSNVVGALKSEKQILVYSDPTLNNISEDEIFNVVKEVVEGI